MQNLKTVMLLWLSFIGVSVMAQTIKVSGVVTDVNGMPVIGASVIDNADKTNGTITDLDGNYTLAVSSRSTLVFSSIGYSDSIVKVEGRTEINVVLQEDAELLNSAEVVAVGYGTVARRDLTGSVAKVDMENIVKSTTSNFDQAIAGRVAGVVVSSSDGSLGAEATITIRGNNSLTQSSAPLYVIDGFPTESSLATSLNPADIESVDVLKDASATAIYGARGANGVIVITTKKGSEGKPKIAFSASWTGNRIANKQELLDGEGFVQIHEDYCSKRNITNVYLQGYDIFSTLYSNMYKVSDYKSLPYVDWQDMIYRDALTQNYNLSISGGSKTNNGDFNTRYLVNVAALSQDGIIVNSNFQRYSAKASIQQNLGPKVTLDLSLNYSKSITNGISPSDNQSSTQSSYLMYSVWGYRPVKSLKYGKVDDSFRNDIIDPDIIEVDPSDQRFNPSSSVRNEYRKRGVDYISGNVALDYKIIEGLKLRISGGYSAVLGKREVFDNTKTASGFPGSYQAKGVNGGIYWSEDRDWVNENTLTWDTKFKEKHHLQVLGGVSFQGKKYDYSGVSAIKMTTESLSLQALSTGVYQPVPSNSYDWTLMSFLGRINYNYDYRYYVTASFRSDGSSKFPKANRWGYFPSASVAWNFNRESFLSGQTWLTNGKLRLSWGQTGNNRTTTPYDFYSQYTSRPGSWQNYDYVRDGVIVPGYFPANMANNRLRWETTEQTDLGLDLAFIDNRIKLTFDIYQKNTYDLLLQATIPSTSGFTSAMINVGSMQNRGLELTLDLVPVRTKNFEWTSSINFAMNRNKVTALADDQYSLASLVNWHTSFSSQYPYITQVGKPTGMMFGFIYEGTYKEDDFTNGVINEGVPYVAASDLSALKPGAPKYKDLNGDGIINDEDRTIIGCGQPLHTGGWNNSFSFYGVDVNLFLQWSYGNDVLNANRLVFENYQGTQLNQFATMKNAYSERNKDSDIPAVFSQGMNYYSSRVVEDGSFLRIKSLSVGYTLPTKVLQKMKMESLRVYVSAENLWTLTRYSGMDPEVSVRNSVLTPGFDWSAYPRARTITLGISVTL